MFAYKIGLFIVGLLYILFPLHSRAADFAPDRLLVITPTALPTEVLNEAVSVAESAESVDKPKPRMHAITQLTPTAQMVKITPGTKASIQTIVDRMSALIPTELDRIVRPALDLQLPLERVSISDPYFTNAWYLSVTGSGVTWLKSCGMGVTVAVLDTGVDATHPDLRANMVAGWNVYDNNATTTDIYGHGTQVAGVVGAVANNGLGAAGYAYCSKIMPIRISDSNGYAYWSTVAQGIQWAADHGAKVANVSFNGISGSLTVQSAADYMRSKDGVVVVAAGNNGRNEGIAASDSLVVVASVNKSGVPSSFTSYGPMVDLCAPGEQMYTTARGGGYSSPSGTSFSSPLVAAVAASMLAVNTTLKPDALVAMLKTSTWPKDELHCGAGQIRGWMAVEQASLANSTPTPDMVDFTLQCRTNQTAMCVDNP